MVVAVIGDVMVMVNIRLCPQRQKKLPDGESLTRSGRGDYILCVKGFPTPSDS
jgi:hypothetical protein